MNLDLDLRTRGRPAKPVEAEFLGPILPEDLPILSMPRPTAEPPPLKQIRDSHHGLARVLASGVTETEASAITGYDVSRISILKKDPQFANLLEFYRLNAQTAAADFSRRMASMGLDALQELHTRLLDSPDEFSPGLLLEVTKVIADRTGHAPAAKTATAVQVNVNLADRMDRAKARIEALRQESVEDVEGN